MMDLQRVYLTNASRCNCQPDRDALLDELSSLASALLIVPLGASAWETLVPDGSNIGRAAGQLYWSDEIGNWLYPTGHPAALFYIDSRKTREAQSLYMNLYYHMRSLPDLLAYGPPDIMSPKIHWIDDIPTARRQLVRLRKHPKLSFDVETSSKKWYDGKLGYLSLSPSSKESFVFSQTILEDKLIRTLLASLFGDKKITFVAHNVKFDDTFLETHLGSCPHNIEDTMFIEYCLDELTGRHLGLKSLGQREFHLPDWSLPMKPYKENYLEAPVEVIVPYVAMDTAVTYALHDKLEPQMDSAERKAYDLMLRAVKMFEVIDSRGVMISKNSAEKLQEVLDNQAIAAKKAVIEFASAQSGERWEINPGSYPQLAKLIFEVMGLRIVKRTPKGKPSTDNEALDKLSTLYPDIPLWKLIPDFRSAKKAAGTYIKPYMTKWGEDVEGHPDLRRLFLDTSQTSTVTGRLSTSKGESPAVMTYPRNMRNLFVAGPPHYAPDSSPDDWIFWQVDFSQLEFRLIAWFSQCQYALEKMQKNISFHKIAAEAVWGPGYSKDQYVRTKNYNFGAFYSLGNPRAGMSAGMDEDAVLRIAEGYSVKMPEMFEWLLQQADKVTNPGYVETMFGRRRRFPFIPNEDMKHEMRKEAANFAAQSPASDITLECMLATFNEFDKNDLTCLLWMMHDGINGYCLRSQLHHLVDIWDLVEKTANDLIGADPPLLMVEMEVGKDWAGDTTFARPNELIAWLD